jgi:hypothetical protein
LNSIKNESWHAESQLVTLDFKEGSNINISPMLEQARLGVVDDAITQ